MMALTDSRELIVRERFQFFWKYNVYDIINPQTQAVIGVASERPRGGWSQVRRALWRGAGSSAEWHVDVVDAAGQRVLTIHRRRGFHWHYDLLDASGTPLGACEYRSQFELFDPAGAKLCWFSPSTRSPFLEMTGRGSNDGPVLATVRVKWPQWWKLIHPLKDMSIWKLSFESTADPRLRFLILSVPIIMDLEFYESSNR